MRTSPIDPTPNKYEKLHNLDFTFSKLIDKLEKLLDVG